MSDTLSKILELEYTYNLGIQEKELHYVVAEIEKTPPPNGGLEIWKQAVEALMNYHRWDILTAEKKKAHSDAHKRCPICGALGMEITLVSNRPAYYCAAHRVVIPKEAINE